MSHRALRVERFDAEWMTHDDVMNLAWGQLCLEQPLKMRGFMGSQVADVLWTGYPPLVCVSTKVVEFLTENEATGWATYPVEVYDRRGDPLPGYHGFAMTGPHCKRDRSRSEIVTRPHPANAERPVEHYKGLYFDESGWDGSDIFRVYSFGGTVVTEKVYRLFRKHRIANVRFTRLTEVEIEVSLDKWEDKDS
jgi:hypothetical protein